MEVVCLLAVLAFFALSFGMILLLDRV